jgi:hypothetical protein
VELRQKFIVRSARNIHKELMLLARQAQNSKPPADALLGVSQFDPTF